MILSFVNVKGGVGKTTTAVNLAAVFAETGLRTLVVDLDPQGSASYSLGLPNDWQGPSVHGVLLDDASVARSVIETGLDGVRLLPSDIRLAGADLTLARRRDPTRVLQRALAPIRRHYEVILVDAPPGLSILPSMALQACHGYVIPTTAHELSVDALRRFFQALETAPLDSPGDLLGIALTMVDHRSGETAISGGAIREAYGRRVLNTEIPLNVALARAPRDGYTVLEYQSWSPGASAYRKLGGELIGRMRRRGLL